jgi:hypothetical protein
MKTNTKIKPHVSSPVSITRLFSHITPSKIKGWLFKEWERRCPVMSNLDKEEAVWWVDSRKMEFRV